MSCPLSDGTKRPRLEVRLKDRFQISSLSRRALHHPVADSWNRKNADLAPILRNLLPPSLQRHIATPDQFVRYLPEESLYALRFDGLEGHPVLPGAPSFFLASAYASRSVSSLQTWTYSPQNYQDVSAFALTYILRLRSCKSMDAFVISSLPSLWSETLRTAGLLRSTGVTPLRRYFEPIRRPLAFDRFPG